MKSLINREVVPSNLLWYHLRVISRCCLGADSCCLVGDNGCWWSLIFWDFSWWGIFWPATIRMALRVQTSFWHLHWGQCRGFQVRVRWWGGSRARRLCIGLGNVCRRRQCTSSYPSPQVSCRHPSVCRVVRSRYRFVCPAWKLQMIALERAFKLWKLYKTHANLKLFLPWTFSEMSVLVCFGSPLNDDGCWLSSLSCENVKSLSWNRSAFLSGFDLMTILRADDVPMITSNVRNCKASKEKSLIILSRVGASKARHRWELKLTVDR